MRDSPERRREILAAALRVMRRNGVRGLTTLAIAREANCSKETLYKWFGDRSGILAALVREQSNQMNSNLQFAISSRSEVRPALVAFGAALLDLLTGEASVQINRAVIAAGSRDEELSQILLEEGRGQTSGLVIALLNRARDDGQLKFDHANEAFGTLVGLVMQDRQIRAIHGDIAARPGGAAMQEIATRAVAQIYQLYAPS